LHISYLASGLGRGDAVFIPSFAWPSAANMACLVGARPVFVDVLPDTYNIDPHDLERRIEDCLRDNLGRPRVIVPVHEFGLPADMDAVLTIASRCGMDVIEDAACALGAAFRGRPVGAFGRMGIFSFHPRKSITTGEGGAIVTNDTELAARCREWRNHGQVIANGKREFAVPGLNYRLTEIQAAIGRVQLEKFALILESRRCLAEVYLQALSGCESLSTPPLDDSHTWQTFMAVLDERIERTDIVAALAAQGIEAGPGSVAGHLGRHFSPSPPLPVAERLHRQGLALPLYCGMETKAALKVASALSQLLV
jgi:perosamine synthetase